MVPAFGFGVGDFIAGLVLLKHTFEAFGDAKGAKASYGELARELSSIQSTLESIQALKCDLVESNTVLKAVDRCQECVGRFVKRLSKFEDLSGTTGESKWSLPTFKRQIHKVEWALCKKSDIEAFRKEIHTHKVAILSLQSTLLSAQGTTHKELSHRIHNSVSTQLQIVKDIHHEVSRAHYLENSECLRSLFVTDPLADRTEIENRKDSLMDDSCSWILDNESFIEFAASDSKNEVLWIHGGPGKGKTMIAISLVDFLSARISNIEKSILCFFFCDNTDAKRNTALNALKSVLHQVLKQSPDNILLSDFQTQGTQMFSSVEAVWMCLVRVLEASVLRTIYILIDGLDECDGESLEALLSLVSRYSSPRSKRNCHIRWIFTSRDDQPIKEHLQMFINIDLEANSEQVAQAVNAFIDLKVEELAVRKHYDPSLKQFVIENLREKSEGTFLWVSLACSELRKRTVSSVNTRLILGKLPPGLSRLYGRILDQVLSNDIEEMVEIAMEILRAVTVALRPLNFGELAVMSGLPNEARMSFGMAREYAEQCGSFLAFRNDYVYLVHQSAKDYLLRHPQKLLHPHSLREEHKKAALRCLHYVTHDWQQDILETCPGDATNLKYPLVNWVDHSNYASEELSKAYSLHNEFFRSNSQLRREWLLYFQKNGQVPNLRHIRPYKFSASHISAICNTVWVAQQLLENRLEFIDFEDSWGLSPLHWAIQARSFQMAGFLLQKGANPNNKGRRTKSETGLRRGTPLGLAASFNNIEIVQLLLRHRAEVNLEDHASMTPLTWSITKNALPVTKLLLQNGAEVNRRNPISKTPLHIAAALGNVQMVRTLLDAGAAVRAADIHGCSPVHESVFNGHTDVTNLLAARGASRYDINQADQWSMYERNKRTADDSQRLSQDTSPLRSWGSSRSRSGPSGRSAGYSPMGGVQPGTTVPALKAWGFFQ